MSPVNFYSFTIWWRHYATRQERDETRDLFIIDHYPKPEQYPELILVKRPVKTLLKAPDGEEDLKMPSTYCRRDGCNICEEGRLKWSFRWRDTRWTPSSCIGEDITETDRIKSVEYAWPIGPRRPPYDKIDEDDFFNKVTGRSKK